MLNSYSEHNSIKCLNCRKESMRSNSKAIQGPSQRQYRTRTSHRQYSDSQRQRRGHLKDWPQQRRVFASSSLLDQSHNQTISLTQPISTWHLPSENKQVTSAYLYHITCNIVTPVWTPETAHSSQCCVCVPCS